MMSESFITRLGLWSAAYSSFVTHHLLSRQTRFADFCVTHQGGKRGVAGDVKALPAIQKTAFQQVRPHESPKWPHCEIECARRSHALGALRDKFVAEGNDFFQPLINRVG